MTAKKFELEKKLEEEGTFVWQYPSKYFNLFLNNEQPPVDTHINFIFISAGDRPRMLAVFADFVDMHVKWISAFLYYNCGLLAIA